MAHTPPSLLCELDTGPSGAERTVQAESARGLTIQLPRLDGWSEDTSESDPGRLVLAIDELATATHTPTIEIGTSDQDSNSSLREYLDVSEGGYKTDPSWRRIHTSPRFACGLEGRFMVGVREGEVPMYEVVLLLARDDSTGVRSAEFVSTTTDPENASYREDLAIAFEGIRVG